MRVSHYHTDFPASGIAERVVASVAALPVRTLLELTDKDMLVISKRDPAPYQNLSYRNLRWEFLDDYSVTSGTSLKNFLFDDQMPEGMEYSYFDEEAFSLLNVIPPEVLRAATHVIKMTFMNARMKIGHIPPAKKIVSLALINRRPPALVPEEELPKYRTNINDALQYYRKVSVKERCILNIDYIPDLCAYYKVSPHWAFSLRGPLFFDTAEADIFFDYFCLISRSQQVTALAMLLSLYPEAESSLEAKMLQRIRHVIENEGGVVL